MPHTVRFLTALLLLCLFPAVNGMAAVWHVCVMDRLEASIPCCPTQEARTTTATGEQVVTSPHAASPCCCASLEVGFVDPALSALDQALHLPTVTLTVQKDVLPTAPIAIGRESTLRDAAPGPNVCTLLCTHRI